MAVLMLKRSHFFAVYINISKILILINGKNTSSHHSMWNKIAVSQKLRVIQTFIQFYYLILLKGYT